MRQLQKLLFIFPIVLLIQCTSAPQGEKVTATDAKEISGVRGEQFSIDEKQSFIEWEGTKPMGKHFGKIFPKNGIIGVENGTISGGTIVIDMNSILCLDLEDSNLNQKLVGHLKSNDFFAVDSFPTSTFEITELMPLEKSSDTSSDDTPDRTHLAKGNLTMRGVSKGIEFPVKVSFDNQIVRVTSPAFTINRTLWRVNYGSKSIFAELKDNFIHDEMGIKLDIVFVKNSAN
ncbi:MAG TPA: YceI family protein [Salinivirgaceae bacterium]|nr:YceI family protein [Salinivirgaceae bacterium]